MKFLLVLTTSLFISLNVFGLAVDSHKELNRLFSLYDKDQDKKITVDDRLPANVVFILKSIPPLKVQGPYNLSNLAQELRLGQINKNNSVEEKYVFENPVDRLSRTIRERFWDGLTRRIDRSTLKEVIKDPKVSTNKSYLYVPHNDLGALRHYQSVKQKGVEIVRLPPEIRPGLITDLGNKQGLLALAIKDGKGVPYVVPGGRFNEMYGWDSYFHVLGTLNDERTDLARSMVDNFVYEIKHYGKILNANRTYYLTRSQPPFLTSMIRAVLATMPQNEETLAWLRSSLSAAIKEYQTVWMGEDRLTNTGLSRYAGFDRGIPPEVEPHHFDHVLIPYAKKHHMTEDKLVGDFNAGKIKDPDLIEFFHQDRAVRESGHDTTYRWRVGKEDRAADFVTVDLNSLLYKYELDLAYLIEKYFKGNFFGTTSKTFRGAALRRKELMRRFLWDPKQGMFFDYNWKLKRPSKYVSATTFYPLWASAGHRDEDKILSQAEAKKLASNSLKDLEENGGLAASSKESLEAVGGKAEERQWDWPNGWAPHQVLAWTGLAHYGLEKDVRRLAYKWLYMITKNARDYNGTVPEKYNVRTMSHKVFAEYGNVGTKFSYITTEGFGWMNASYQLGLKFLTPELLSKLRRVEKPEF